MGETEGRGAVTCEHCKLFPWKVSCGWCPIRGERRKKNGMSGGAELAGSRMQTGDAANEQNWSADSQRRNYERACEVEGVEVLRLHQEEQGSPQLFGVTSRIPQDKRDVRR